MKQISTCWCGNDQLKHYSDLYWHCAVCETLVLKEWLNEDLADVADDGELYSKDYYLKRLPSEGYPTLAERTWMDLNGRIPHWFRALLKYQPPPASVLELGSAHGGFVAYLSWAGYQVTGLELSPWLISFAKETYGVSLLKGRVEDQVFSPQSFDVVLHMDVLEHLPDPLATMQHALGLLKPGGMMLLQTPCFKPEKPYHELLAQKHPFLAMLKPFEHLYLFSESSLRFLFAKLGWNFVQFEPAIYQQYDMFAVICKEARLPVSQEMQNELLRKTPLGRLVQATLQLYSRVEYLQQHADARLRIIEEQREYIAHLESKQSLEISKTTTQVEKSALQKFLNWMGLSK